MGDEFKDLETSVPTLTLEPEVSDTASETAQAVAEAVEEAPVEAEAPKMEETILSPEEQKMVDEFAEKIDIENTNQILQYGAGTQKKMADFSDSALANVKTQDMGEVGNLLAGVVTELKDFDAFEDEKGFFAFFKKQGNKLENLKNRYAKAEVNVEKIADALQQHQIRLMKDSAVLDKMYEQNLNYYKELTMYVLAGKKKLQEVRDGELRELREKAEKSGLPEDAQAAKDLADKCDRFEKKLYDLELTKTISMQTAPQIRLIQSNNTSMVEKIQTTIMNTIPLWKSQMVLALGIAHSTEAAKAQAKVTNLTNELLKENAEALHTASVETAKEAERGIVDIETLKKTNEDLIRTFDDVMKIQEDGRNKRRQAEQEIARMEKELKDKLLEIRR
ncbi:MAG: toxic anion resistance protein [Blautia sp.]|nr:toxic anion resistance protein [Blautia sp.]